MRVTRSNVCGWLYPSLQHGFDAPFSTQSYWRLQQCMNSFAACDCAGTLATPLGHAKVCGSQYPD